MTNLSRTNAAKREVVEAGVDWHHSATMVRTRMAELETELSAALEELTEANQIIGGIKQAIVKEVAAGTATDDVLDDFGVWVDHHATVEAERDQLRTQLAEANKQIEMLSASLPLRNNQTAAEAQRLCGQVSRHDDGEGASHGCVEIQTVESAVNSLLADKEQMRQQLTATEALIERMRNVVLNTKVRIAYIGMPQEAIWNGKPDWRKLIAELEEVSQSTPLLALDDYIKPALEALEVAEQFINTDDECTCYENPERMCKFCSLATKANNKVVAALSHYKTKPQ